MTSQPDRLREAAQAFIEASVLVDTITINNGPAYQDAWDAYHFAQGELRAALAEAAPAPDLPIGEPDMHRHDGLGAHRRDEHHRKDDFR